MNISEILMDNIAVPIIQFSTYNPYKSTIVDFTRNELELYSNLLFFIQISKRLLQVFVTLSQVDIAVISWISSQLSAYYAIRYLLDNVYVCIHIFLMIFPKIFLGIFLENIYLIISYFYDT